MYPFYFGIPDRFFRRGDVPMTKEEVRVVVLAKLCLREDLVLWDVGAGTGSVAVEAARLLSRGRVFAVEKDGEACDLIEENTRIFGVKNLIVIRGEAPEVLSSLPDPDRVFVGGNGKKLLSILETAVRRLTEEGVIVVNGVTLETAGESVNALERWGLSCRLVWLHLSFGERVGGRHLLRAANPVYVIQGRREYHS